MINRQIKKVRNLFAKKRRKKVPTAADRTAARKRKLYYNKNKNKIKLAKEKRERKLTRKEKTFREERKVVLRARRSGLNERVALRNYREKKRLQ